MEENDRLLLIYEIFMAILALVVIAILFIELISPITEEQRALFATIDLSVVAIFAVDYFYRLIQAKDKWQYFKGNIFELIAIMPFDKAFRIARLARLSRIARLLRLKRLARFSRVFRFTRLLRLFAFFRRFGNTFSGIIKTNGLIYMILAMIVIVIGGAFGILALEPGIGAFGDAIWWSLATATSVGYYDISPESAGGRVLAGILMIVRIGFIGMLTASVTTYFVDRLWNKEVDQKSVLDEQIEYVKRKLGHLETLSTKDLARIQEIIISVWKGKRKEE